MSPTESTRKVLTPHGKAVLTSFFDHVSHNPTPQQRTELAAVIRNLHGCAHYTPDKVAAWFTRARKAAAAKETRKSATSRTILYPSLTDEAIANLSVLEREHQYEWTQTIVDLFARRLNVSSQDVSTWIALKRHNNPLSSTHPQTRPDGTQLPTPGISRSPEPILPTPVTPTFPCTEFSISEPSSPMDPSPLIAFARHIVPPNKYRSFISSQGPSDTGGEPSAPQGPSTEDSGGGPSVQKEPPQDITDHPRVESRPISPKPVEPKRVRISMKQRLRQALEIAKSKASEPPPTNTQEWNERWEKIEPMMRETIKR